MLLYYIYTFFKTCAKPIDTRPVTPSYTTACKARLCVTRGCIREFHTACPQIVLGPGGHRIRNIRLMPTDSDVLDRFVKMKMMLDLPAYLLIGQRIRYCIRLYCPGYCPFLCCPRNMQACSPSSDRHGIIIGD